MHSQTTSRFWKSFDVLPTVIQEKAKRVFKLWRQDSSHQSLHFKKIHSSDPIYSVRIDLQYRALGVKENDTIIWFWIGTHEDYNSLLSEL